MSLQHPYDDLDRKLIALLRKDGRASVSKLAVILSVSRATVQARIDRLLDGGAVIGFTNRAREDSGPHGITNSETSILLSSV